MPHCGALVPPALAIRQPTDSLQVINMFDNFLLSLSRTSPSGRRKWSYSCAPYEGLPIPEGLRRMCRGMLPPEGKNGRIRAPPTRGCLIPLSGAHCEELYYHKTRKWSYLCAPRPSTWLASILREDFTAEVSYTIRLRPDPSGSVRTSSVLRPDPRIRLSSLPDASSELRLASVLLAVASGLGR
ncbi:hypothetical protein K438DRAFT_2002264 [Mycena galopus ATCC 62051]|nr:hypothetical protein K438DRAFT_2002264 [Mycena galopus ATCC 62051]